MSYKHDLLQLTQVLS